MNKCNKLLSLLSEEAKLEVTDEEISSRLGEYSDEYKDHPRIKSVKHTYLSKFEWKDVLQRIVLNHLDQKDGLQ